MVHVYTSEVLDGHEPGKVALFRRMELLIPVGSRFDYPRRFCLKQGVVVPPGPYPDRHRLDALEQ